MTTSRTDSPLAHHHAGTQPDRPRGQGQAAEQGLDEGRLARPVRPHQPDALGPADLEVEGPQAEVPAGDYGPVEATHHGPGPRSLFDGESQVPALPRLVDGIKALDGALGPAGARRQFLGPVDPEVALGLVVITGITTLAAHGGGGPLALAYGPVGQFPSLGLMHGERLLGVPAGRRPFLQVGRPSSSEQASRMVVLIDLQYRLHGGVEKGAVVRDDDHAPRPLRHHGLEAAQAVEVEVVGGFVEEGDVEARQHDGGQRHPGDLATGQGGDILDDDAGREAELLEGARDPGVEVSGRQPVVAVEGQSEALLGPRFTATESLAGGGQFGLGGGHPGPAVEGGAHGLPRFVLVLLGQVAHRGPRRIETHGPVAGRLEAGQEAQEGGLPHPVGTHDADARRGRHGERHVVQDGVGATVERESGGHQGGGNARTRGHGRPPGRRDKDRIDGVLSARREVYR